MSRPRTMSSKPNDSAESDSIDVSASSNEECNPITKTFPEGTPHRCDIYLQVDDDGRLHDALSRIVESPNEESGYVASSDNPYKLGSKNMPWTHADNEQDIGLFPTGMQYGRIESCEWTQSQSLVLNLYDDLGSGSDGIANNPRKRRIEVRERSDDLVYEDGNDYTWPEGWQTGTTYTGTAIKIEASYVFDPTEAISHAFQYLYVALGEATAEKFHRNIIQETIRFGGLELHHRHHSQTKDTTVETLKDTAKLLIRGSPSGEVQSINEKGHCQLYAFSTDNLESAGFNTDITYNLPDGTTKTETVSDHYIKEYMHIRAHRFLQSNPLSHPKLEVRQGNGAFPAPAWDAVIEHLHEVLHSFVEWAGISEDDLVPDKWYSPEPQIETVVPNGQISELRTHFQDENLRVKVQAMMSERQTKTTHDILYLVLYRSSDNEISYDTLADKTGLAKDTIGQHVSELVDLQVVSRNHRGPHGMHVCITPHAKEKLSGLFDQERTHGEILDKIEARKESRAQQNESESEPRVETENSDKQSSSPSTVLSSAREIDTFSWVQYVYNLISRLRRPIRWTLAYLRLKSQ